MVYVISFEGKALMPTSNAKARKLLKQNKAKAKNLKPFTIQLTYRTETEYTQEICTSRIEINIVNLIR